MRWVQLLKRVFAIDMAACPQCGGLSVTEVGHRLYRDPSMISRLYPGYVANRTPPWEKLVRAILKIKVNTPA